MLRIEHFLSSLFFCRRFFRNLLSSHLFLFLFLCVFCVSCSFFFVFLESLYFQGLYIWELHFLSVRTILVSFSVIIPFSLLLKRKKSWKRRRRRNLMTTGFPLSLFTMSSGQGCPCSCLPLYNFASRFCNSRFVSIWNSWIGRNHVLSLLDIDLRERMWIWGFHSLEKPLNWKCEMPLNGMFLRLSFSSSLSRLCYALLLLSGTVKYDDKLCRHSLLDPSLPLELFLDNV